MTLTPNSGVDTISQLISRVMDKYDGDKDGKLTSQEFGSFLTGLLGATGAAPANAAAAAGGKDPMEGTGQYRMRLAGFDHAKIDNPTLQGAGTSKYIAARIFQDYPPMPESLPAVVERLKAQGLDARQTDFDKIDFGDGYGPIDVIQGAYPGGGVAWQWLPVGA
ncbi:MAG: EF-hand domain-containing protein [Vicinamibacterales bacterium]